MRPLWEPDAPDPMRVPLDVTEPQLRSFRRITWRHWASLIQYGVNPRDLTQNGLPTFGIALVAGREMIVTDNPKIRSYLTGPGIFKLPGE